MPNLTNRYSIETIAHHQPTFLMEGKALPAGTEVAITSLPSDELQLRIAAAETVRLAGHIPIPHVAARRIGSAAALHQMVDGFTRIGGVDRMFIIAGDAPKPAGPFADALAVINDGVLLRHGIKRIGIAGHPEGHPSITAEQIWRALLDKHTALLALGLPYEIVTQFSFDADAILSWLTRLRDNGILAPVKIGVPGPASLKSLLRYASICGVNASSKVLAKYGLSLTALLGHSGPDRLVRHLEDHYRPAAHGDVSLHFYPFGGLVQTADWLRNYRDRANASDVAKDRTRRA